MYRKYNTKEKSEIIQKKYNKSLPYSLYIVKRDEESYIILNFIYYGSLNYTSLSVLNN